MAANTTEEIIDEEAKGQLLWAFKLEEGEGGLEAREDEYNRALALMEEPERERISRFVFRIDAVRALVGRLLIRQACRRVLGIPCHSQQLLRTAENKPYLASPHPSRFPSWNFNISHDGRWVALAAHPSRLAGMDVAALGLRPPHSSAEEFFALMSSVLLPTEWLLVRSTASQQDALLQFFTLWALKESYVKATGAGLSVEPHHLSFHFDPSNGYALSLHGKLLSNWSFRVFLLDPAHVAAVALGPVSDAVPSFRRTLSESEPIRDASVACEPVLRQLQLEELFQGYT